ncbi:MerR family transcriptional regulator [Bordetella avium]|uniref:MerR family transcriptional regulator n=1 Tax=Bordetella avium TaxID=521 RepID=UPI000E67D1F9|nr:MerR family transcriptional regulator [Bordetella avium]RIQ18753.1 MerR family transcriptional regulator [Bordetella avium]RIQ35212.1 MerR family transcriptional regulator [Bordetella avium]RIQ72052.1 MerR family transcriptional regulator [Bordetella avium]
MTPLTLPPVLASLDADDGALPIAAVERETGIGKDTLRVWERRYGFPKPSRDSSGDRRYSAAQLQQLKLIRRLLDAGARPGKVVGLDQPGLQALLTQQALAPPVSLSRTNPGKVSDYPLLHELLSAIGAHDPQRLRHGLSYAQARIGLERFVTDLVAPLTTAVGEAWAQGRFEIFEEHLYTEVVTGVLRQAIVSLSPPAIAQRPKVLLTTMQQEPHGLGLLMVEALLALECCTCVSLGTQTPLSDIIQAARAHRADVVVMSFSNIHKGAVVPIFLHELRALLAADTELWVGGGCTALYQRPLAGVSTVRNLAGLAPLVAQWRQAHRT